MLLNLYQIGNYMNDYITPSQAVKRMRQLTDNGAQFSFSFMSYSSKKHHCSGIKHVAKAQLRKGYTNSQSELSQQLIGYVDIDAGHINRFFHLPLLLSFNNYQIKP
jgi:hypothetical protein